MLVKKHKEKQSESKKRIMKNQWGWRFFYVYLNLNKFFRKDYFPYNKQHRKNALFLPVYTQNAILAKAAKATPLKAIKYKIKKNTTKK